MVRSPDGTNIGFESFGEGADIVYVHGGVSDRAAWRRVAENLPGYAHHLLDRRGRGLSAEERSPYSFDREYEDIAAVTASLPGPVHLAGHSSGAICALGAALHSDRLASLILYEPPLPIENQLPIEVIEQMEVAVASGRRAEAIRVGIVGIAGVPGSVAKAMSEDEKRLSLIHTWARECRAINELAPNADLYGSVTVPTLLLVGTETTSYQRKGVVALAASMPRSEIAELEGQGHVALALAPHLVSDAIARFLTDAAA
jgi:pimeloyl-ACP methyl ester carboxylesterase